VPAGEYLMALSAHCEGPSGAPVFLGAQDFSRLCLEFGLPVNDTWLVAGRHWASKARELLDDMSTQVGGPGRSAGQGAAGLHCGLHRGRGSIGGSCQVRAAPDAWWQLRAGM
jgi:hypothetical protein